MGTPDFSVPSLKAILEKGFDVSSVVTVPDRKIGRGLKLTFCPVKEFAIENELKLLQPDNLKDPLFIDNITNQNPDLIIVVAFRILPENIFSIPKFGTINLHASLLPKYRGAAPINWAIINGEKETGLTTFFINEKVDTGNIILQKKVSIFDEECFGELYRRLSTIGAELLISTINLITENNYGLSMQDELLSTPAPKIFKENCKIDWDQEAVKIHNLIRGLSPYPAAFCYYKDQNLKIFKTNISGINSESEPGKLLIISRNLYVNTKDYLLEILELQLEGKKKIKSSEFINSIPKNKDIVLS